MHSLEVMTARFLFFIEKDKKHRGTLGPTEGVQRDGNRSNDIKCLGWDGVRSEERGREPDVLVDR